MSNLAEKSLLEEPGKTSAQEPTFLELPPPLEETPARRRNPVRYFVAAAILAAAVTAAFLIWRSLSTPPAPTYSLVTVNRGNISKTITAT